MLPEMFFLDGKGSNRGKRILLLFALWPSISCSKREEVPRFTKVEAVEQGADLEQIMTRLQSAVLEGDDESAILLGESLFPTEETLALSCLKEEDPLRYRDILTWFESVKPRNSRDYLKIYRFKDWQTEVVVTAMTGAELAEFAGRIQGAPGFHPQASTLAAGGLLRPEKRFYSVDFRNPGDHLGNRFELFVWDGEADGWRMLGPIWRAIRVAR